MDKPRPSSPKLTSPQLLSALSHPTRAYVLSVLTDRTASPKELAKELDRSIRHVTYHLEKLEEVDAVEPVCSEARSGGRVIETFYRATRRPWFDRDAWRGIGPKARSPMTGAVMGLMNEDINKAIAAGTFDGSENHISRTPMRLDLETYEELIVYLADVLENLVGLMEKSANRIGPDTETIWTIVNVIQFDLPPSVPGADEESDDS